MSNGYSSITTSPKGYQNKGIDHVTGFWYKTDGFGGEAVCEVLVSEFLYACTNSVEFVSYFLEDSIRVCYSFPFMVQGEDILYTFHKVAKIKGWVFSGTPTDKKQQLIDRVSETINSYKLAEKYVNQMLFLDMMFRNTDRHLNNFGFIKRKGSNTLELLPLYDFGLSLFIASGVYWDFDNVLSGNDGSGGVIKPLEVTVKELEPILENPFNFDVYRFIRIHTSKITLENKLFRAFLWLIIKYFPTDCNGRDTRAELERTFGRIRKGDRR